MAKKNASLTQIADRYVSALFPLAEKDGAVDATATELKQLAALFEENEAFRSVAENPAYAPDAKGTIVSGMLTQWKATPLTVRFTALVAKRGRLSALPQMAKAFAARQAEARGELHVEIVSAKPLSEKETASLTQPLAAGSGAKVVADVTVDPSLIAGVILKTGSKELDYSLAGKLRQIKGAVSVERLTA